MSIWRHLQWVHFIYKQKGNTFGIYLKMTYQKLLLLVKNSTSLLLGLVLYSPEYVKIRQNTQFLHIILAKICSQKC